MGVVEMCDLQCVCETVAAGATGLRRGRPAVQLRVNLRQTPSTQRSIWSKEQLLAFLYIRMNTETKTRKDINP